MGTLTETEVRELAHEHVLRVLTEQVAPDSEREHVAVMAWLDGFAAGHASAMAAAVDVVRGETDRARLGEL